MQERAAAQFFQTCGSDRKVRKTRQSLVIQAQAKKTMPPKKQRKKSAYLDLETAADEDGGSLSSDDVPFSEKITDPAEQLARAMDKAFINDKGSPSPSPRDDPNVSSDDEQEVQPRRSGRLQRNESAVSPPPIPGADGEYDHMPALGEDFDFGSSSDSDEPSPSPSPSPKKKKKKKRKTRSHQTISSRSRSISKKRIRKLALWKLIGKQLVAIALEHGHSWEECLMGFYDSWSDGDLPVAEFHRAHEWFQTHFIFHSLGRERGEDMGKLHTQGHGATLAPATKAGCTAMAQKYKEDMNIVTHSRRKVQFKLMEAGQPEDKMCAYTRKWRSFHEFLFVSSDRNNEPYTEEYLGHCDDKYRVQFTQNGLDYF